MRFFVQILGVVSVCFVVGCVSSTIRLPASFKPKYNNEIVSSLQNAATNGILFQVSDSVFRDVPARQVERCRHAEAPMWSAQVMSTLDIFKKHPEYFNKFHIIDIKRGDKARVEVSSDLSHVSYLTIMYAKRETREKITPATTMPCLESNSDYIGKDMITTNIDWPSNEEVRMALSQAPEKEDVESFKFNTAFLEFLAERQAVLKINPEVPFAKNIDGDRFIKLWLEKMAQEIKTPENVEYLSYWLKEISTHSKQATKIQFFGLHAETDISYGVQVDTAGKFSRKLNSYQEPTYVFASYKEDDGDILSGDMKDLNHCLQELYGIYGNPLAMGTQLESDEESFLSPGYSCKTEIKKK